MVDGTAIGPAAVFEPRSDVSGRANYLEGTSASDSLDLAIEVAGADKGTLQRLDAESGCLKMVASRGFSDEFLKYFETVDPNTNTTCAAALKRRMRN